LERRARAIVMTDLDQELGKEPPFEVIPGNGRYHAIAGTDPSDVGAETQLAEALSLECDEPVYSIERANDPWAITAWRNGALDVLEDVDPDSLARSLGCPLPGSERSSDSPARKPLRNVAWVEGVRAEEARRVLEEGAGEPLPPGRYCFEDTPKGLLISSGTGSIGYADLTVSEKFPHARVYGLVASPSLDTFFVNVLQAGACIGQFAHPPEDLPHFPVLNDIKGERSPERILGALGISPECFRNE
jgi:hypothetical protein